MLRLEPSTFEKVLEPLQMVTINHLFADAVVNQHVSGAVYADEREAPGTFYVVHPYGMSLLFGDCGNHAFNRQFRAYALNIDHQRAAQEWMQAFPDAWDQVLVDLFQGHMLHSSDNHSDNASAVEMNTRVNFRFNPIMYQSSRPAPDPQLTIVRTDARLFTAMQGSVVPSHFWDDAASFGQYGIGFSVLYDGTLAATAFSSFINDQLLEVGIECVPAFRGRGLARYACTALIDYCLKHNYEPVWSCRRENTASYRLACALGFEPTIQIAYYRLARSEDNR